MFLNAIPPEVERLGFAEKIKELARLAGEADPGLKVFGSGKHKYRFNPAASLDEVRDFESKVGMKLPEDYVTFLTQVGNGGAGVDYGMYSIQEAFRSFDSQAASEGLTLYDYDDPVAEYVKKAKMIDQLDGTDKSEEMDSLYADITRGMLFIGTAGCTYDYFIMCKGRFAGKVGIMDWNMMPERNGSPIMYDLTLPEFLEDYFKRIIIGKLIDYSTFKSVNFTADIRTKRRAIRDELPNTVSAPEPARSAPEPEPAPTPEPAPVPEPVPTSEPDAARQPAPDPEPAPSPEPRITPPPQPSPVPAQQKAPQPEPRPRRIYKRNDFIRHKKYGNGIVTNVVGNIITADYFDFGSRSIMLPYDAKDLIE